MHVPFETLKLPMFTYVKVSRFILFLNRDNFPQRLRVGGMKLLL